MSTAAKKSDENAFDLVGTLTRHPNLVRQIPKGDTFHHSQSSTYGAEPHYKKDSDTRYSDPDQNVGVYYLGGSAEVAVAESFQPGQGVDDQAVRLSKLEQCSMHRLKTARILNVIDVVGLANHTTHNKLRDMVQAKGQGNKGYSLTREFSQACMQLGSKIDGLLYPSAVYSVTGSMAGCNLVLFEGRGTQVEPIDYKPVTEVELSNGDTAVEFLESLGVVIE